MSSKGKYEESYYIKVNNKIEILKILKQYEVSDRDLMWVVENK